MTIEEQIKKLLRVKAKIDLYRKVMENVNAELASVNQDDEHKTLEKEHPDLIKEFCSEVSRFCTRTIENLNDTSIPNSMPKTVESRQDVPKMPEENAKSEPMVASKEEEVTDPLRFLLKYKYLDGKRVKLLSKDGEVQATVRGLVVPNIVIETDTGFTIKVSPKELQVIG